MARTVVRASSQYLEATDAPLPLSNNATYSLSIWYKPSSIANGTALGLGSTASSEYVALGMDGSGVSFVEISGNTVTGPTLSNGVWSHLAAVQSSSSSRVVYANGTPGSAATFTYTPGPFTTFTVGGLMLNGTRLSFAGGDVAEAAVWDAYALTAGEVADLSAGRNPVKIAAASLVRYWRILGTESPEPEYLAGVKNLTVSGATAAAHPNVDPPGAEVFTYTRKGMRARAY